MMDLYIAIRNDDDSVDEDGFPAVVAYVATDESEMRELLADEGYEARDSPLSPEESMTWEDCDGRTIHVEHWVPSIDEPAGYKWVEDLGPEGE